MAALPGVRVFLKTCQSLSCQRPFRFVPVQLASTGPSRTFSSESPKQPVNPENETLIQSLSLMGVDLTMARRRQPGVLRKDCTNEKGLARFLQGKGASLKTIASIVSRYPRSITRSVEHLEQRWRLWRNVFQTDAEIVSILDRSPESFFRSSDNGNLEKNIAFLTSLGLNSKDLHRMLTTAPRTFSNSVELNKQMVEFLEDICAELGGDDPEQFAKTVIARNLYILIRSTRRVRANIDNLRASLHLSDSELLVLLQGHGAEILDLSSEYLKKNFQNLLQKMTVLGCQEADVKKLLIGYPMILYIGPETLNRKIDCLLKGGVTVTQILKKPKVLDYSTQNITERLTELQRVGYDFSKNGINILDSSRKRFVAKMEKLSSEEGNPEL
ncbi:Transcription termination factor 1, mitochondrial [Oryzias melastigma]|uniref:Mitochondrial transcription termination factor 1 n=1 Tax=Oryzias melastigma TaxID=30732 RepID=A0A3B3E2Q0_ORYME|nr:transcription termination factor 1, mitochondrial [Oryzias melastigma]XP_024131357.1 transcription termination factor 1, mitochondrial [Oryzias melastigma]XP_024131365.1 transcription termination factor 1, mitochondrial [Oryzias melastigma]KAF6722811.1 Transcription termination factor 1, mitochondrial [Oryzias melastigma]